MFKIILGICFLIVGCNTYTSNETVTSSEMQYTPAGAKFIQDRGNRWIEWELDGNCFLSYDLTAHHGLLTTIPCKTEQPKDK